MSDLAGTSALVRLAARRDRVRLLVWALSVIALVVVTASSTKGFYPTQASLDDAAAATRDNPAALAFNGPDVALDTMGGQVAFQVGATGLALVGLMNLLLVVRLTRGEEDSGRLELVRSMPVGRHASLAAALVVVIAVDIAIGGIVAISLVLLGLPAAGSLVFGASMAALGAVFAAVAAATAQVTENPRVASGLAGAVLAASFVLRAIGDAGSGALSWVSPIGWAQKTRPYGGDVAWPLVLCAGAAAVLIAVAVRLAARRDYGAGLVPPRPGPARAGPRLGTPLALAFRLQRGAVFWWTVSMVALSVAWGSLASSIEDFTKDNQALEDVLARAGQAGITDSYLATTLLFSALIAGGAALQIITRLRSEETDHRADPVLATPTSRTRWAGGHLAAALAGSGLAVAAGGLALGVTYALVIGDAGQIGRLLAASLVYLPPVWLLAGLAMALMGAAPRWVGVAWAAWAFCFVLGLFGTLVDVPSAVRNLSPFEDVPSLPADSMQALPVVVVAVVAVVLAAVGLAGFRTRDLA